jgi:UDP-N-acetyl-alpha-D-quinovosamine dehydrogenase
LVHGPSSGETRFRADQPPAPADTYAHAKLAIEQAMQTTLADGASALAIIRPPLVYGAEVGARFRALLRLVQRAPMLPFAGIQNRRSLLYRENLADLIVRIVAQPQPIAGCFLARDDEEPSTPALVRRLGHHLGHTPLLLPCPAAWLRGAARILGQSGAIDRLTRSLRVDDQTTRAVLRWSPPYDLDEGLRETCRWFLAAGGHA